MTRMRRIVFTLVQNASSLVIAASRFAPGHKPKRKRK
jgi:hypothetical protein